MALRSRQEKHEWASSSPCRLQFVGPKQHGPNGTEPRPARRLVTLAVEATDADAVGYEPILQGDALVGVTTSGGYGHCCQRSLAMGYVDTLIDDSAALSVMILGERRGCRILSEVPIDPRGGRLRG